MIDARARALSETALLEIVSSLNLAASPEDFLIAVDEILDNPTKLLALPVDCGVAEAIAPRTGGAGVDIDNGPAVYEYLGAIDASNASDPRLWTYLAFSTYRDYMQARWPLSLDINWKSRVEDRWLMLNPTRGDLIRHGIARLWWVTSLTYDARCEYPLAAANHDPFAYTRAAFRNEDRIIGMFDREVGAVRPLVRAILEYAAGSETQVTDKMIRKLMKEVTLVYGFRDIEILADEQLRELVRDLALSV